jgi:FkbM family methyltransferase
MTEEVSLRGYSLRLFRHEAVCSVIRDTGDFYEAGILDALRERRPHEGVILDVGAHIGNHSVYWTAFVPHDLLVAFEPAPESYALLRENVPAALTLPLALSDVSGIARMRQDEVNRGRTRIDPDGDLPVLTVRLDDLGLEPSFVKLDVEGWQARVLRGGRQTLARWRPALLIEDGEGDVGPTLRGLGLDGYQLTVGFPGANYLWEWV